MTTFGKAWLDAQAPADYYPGAWVFIRRHGHPVTVGEITGENARHPSLFDVWCVDTAGSIAVNITARGQAVLRAAAPAWAIHAVDTNGEG